ncbi:MAG TPA: lipoyl(octanoyl) transferase LipB [Candidatus Omnitrophota bacterium]|nr:lipoyl(octanoyl) transferase LipB [Candidatus Omnitrophota bacterium]HPD83934.1 lipoyl(octanoyl) transferase LipB [Candidatus Omnitrophota bacterium]HRZ02791.1 lipoyl(octanoyl) transferase LipB [Candidatus Omnitrophota bacterium]
MILSQDLLICRTKDIGLTDFFQACQLQKKFVQEVIDGGTDILLLTEHAPVLTLGSMATESNILLSGEMVKARGIGIARVDRGGEVTFHGPGQLVVYPILNLNKFGRDLKSYLSKLEQVAIDLLRYFGIVANSVEGKRGVFVGPKKIASIGIGVRKWVSYHGMAINVNTDLRYFSTIKPCGLEVEMTSMERILGKSLSMDAVKGQAINCFCDVFNLKITKA